MNRIRDEKHASVLASVPRELARVPRLLSYRTPAGAGITRDPFDLFLSFSSL